MTMAGDVVCPSDTAVTEFWRLETFFFFFCTSSSLFELVRCSRRGKYCQFFFFFAGGLVGVDKHLVEVVSLV